MTLNLLNRELSFDFADAIIGRIGVDLPGESVEGMHWKCRC